MRTVLLASVRIHARRYLAAVLAVALGTAFVVVIGMVSAAARDGVARNVALPYRGATTVVTGLTGAQAADLVARTPGATVVATGHVPLRLAAGGGPEVVSVAGVSLDPRTRWQQPVAGRLPRTAGEVLVDRGTARSLDLRPGDRISLGEGADRVRARVVGLARTPLRDVGSDLYATWADQAPWISGLVDEVVVTYASVPTDLPARVRAVAPGAVVMTGAAFVEQRSLAATRGVDVLGAGLSVFAAIALFVAALVIANTFTIVFAQRRRDLALLRCVGATRGQVRRSVRLEALAMGVVASVVGLGVGLALGWSVLVAVRRLAPGAGLGGTGIGPRWVVAALLLGVGVTVAASWWPTRAVTRVPPLAALRPEGPAVGAAASRVRVGGGVLVGLLGVLGLAAAVETVSVPAMLAGGVVVGVAILLAGSVIVPGALRGVRVLLGPVGGPSARLALDNAVRNPRRTAATAASLVVGVTLTVAVLTGTASARDGVLADVAAHHPVDAALTDLQRPVAAGVLAAVARTPGVAGAVAVPGLVLGVDHGVGRIPVLVPSPSALRTVLRPGREPLDLRAGSIALPASTTTSSPYVTVRLGNRSQRLRVVPSPLAGPLGVVAPRTLAALSPTTPAPTRAVWVRAAAGADTSGLVDALRRVASGSGLELTEGISASTAVVGYLDVLSAAVVALLAMSVLIALIGIADTLGLSVLERARENALLRALGLSRRQLRASLVTEGLVLSLVAAVIGTVVGVGFAWVGVQVVVAPALEAPLVLPVAQLAVVLLVAALAGVLSSVVPARRAARVAPAQGLALD